MLFRYPSTIFATTRFASVGHEENQESRVTECARSTRDPIPAYISDL